MKRPLVPPGPGTDGIKQEVRHKMDGYRFFGFTGYPLQQRFHLHGRKVPPGVFAAEP